MAKPSSNRPPAGSNMLTYITVSIVSLGALGFMFFLFGELFFLAVVVFAVIGGIGCIHYFTWGKTMTENAKKEAQADFDSPERS
jgi:ABC-type bacteriocin/lantibiotic exporter with double-glycine peptidase domain